jgi:hypothetical protein
VGARRRGREFDRRVGRLLREARGETGDRILGAGTWRAVPGGGGGAGLGYARGVAADGLRGKGAGAPGLVHGLDEGDDPGELAVDEQDQQGARGHARRKPGEAQGERDRMPMRDHGRNISGQHPGEKVFFH